MGAADQSVVRSEINVLTLLHMGPYLAKFDIDTVEFMRRLGISPNMFVQRDAWFDRDKVFEAANRMAEATGKPYAAAFAGDEIPVAGFGDWGTIVSQAETLHQACMLMARKLDLLHRGSRISIHDEASSFRMAFSFVGSSRNDPLQILLGSLAVMKNAVSLCGHPDAVRVHMTMPWSYRARDLDGCLGPNLQFGSRFDGVEIDIDALATGMPTAPRKDRTTRAIDTTIATAVAIDDLLETGTATIDRIADRLSLSVRTLQRRLKHCGVDFEDLLDVSRRDAALAELQGGASNMTDLAFRLGYADPASFTRAFRRWTGSRPTQYKPSPARGCR